MNRKLLSSLCIVLLIQGGVFYSKDILSKDTNDDVSVVSNNVIKSVNSSEIINEIESYGANVSSIEKGGGQHKIIVQFISDKKGVEELISKLTNYNLVEYEIEYSENTYFLKLHLEIR